MSLEWKLKDRWILCFRGLRNCSLLEWRHNLRRKRYVFPIGGWRNKSSISPGIYFNIPIMIKNRFQKAKCWSIICDPMASQRLLTVCLFLTCVSSHIFTLVQYETSNAARPRWSVCISCSRWEWGRCWCSSEGNLYNNLIQFAVPLRISVSLLGDGRSRVAFGYFFLDLRFGKNCHQNRQKPADVCEWLEPTPVTCCNPGEFWPFLHRGQWEGWEGLIFGPGVGWYGDRLVFSMSVERMGWEAPYTFQSCYIYRWWKYDPVFKRNFDGTSTILQLLLRMLKNIST